MSNRASNSPLRVAVSQRVDYLSDRNEFRDSLDTRLIDWLQQIEMLPFPVPNKLLSPAVLWTWLDMLSPQAVVLSGGNDLGDCPERDTTEAVLLRYAASGDLPVLGICRGMQMLAHHEGGILERISGHIDTAHALVAVREVELPDRVNSFHSWTLTGCPNGYEVIAKAPDGCIEAIRHTSRRWEGWMWHPERDSIFDPVAQARARQLLAVDFL